MAKQNRANRLATGVSRIRDAARDTDSDVQDPALASDDAADPDNVPTAGDNSVGAENGAVDDLLKSLMAGTDLERVEATKRRRRRELMSIRRRSSVRRSVHRTSISIKALQMLRDIKEEDGDSGDENPRNDGSDDRLAVSAGNRSLLRRHPTASQMSTISEDGDAPAEPDTTDFDLAELRAARRRRQILEDD
ncbi:hypothetical protein LPJ61_006968 [Coemansia biformis]|uniref:Uncharacterized protein n=1 Tax=Coemansia biformis TaxID=1286918 RepID=A0A9W7XS24_9FUNG|nr:hypothetical protein LPJ61_006968 [Coemansia biformis]